jgi:hypothetical protein
MSEFYLYELSDPEYAFIRNYRRANRLKDAALLKNFQIEGCFPESFGHIPNIERNHFVVVLTYSCSCGIVLY